MQSIASPVLMSTVVLYIWNCGGVINEFTIKKSADNAVIFNFKHNMTLADEHIHALVLFKLKSL